MPWVTEWWPNIEPGGSSAWSARKLGHYLGYKLVVLCGCPLDPGNYANHHPGGFMNQKKVLDDLRQVVYDDLVWHTGVVSMSGWTKSVLGEPG